MNLASYKIISKSDDSTEYKFLSTGPKGEITKLIIFEELNFETNLYNLALVDLLANGIMSDSNNSNNGDLRKILATVAKVLMDYTLIFPERTIYFEGSDEEGKRNALYNRAISSYLSFFENDLIIKGITEGNVIETYNPLKKYSAFLWVQFKLILLGSPQQTVNNLFTRVQPERQYLLTFIETKQPPSQLSKN